MIEFKNDKELFDFVRSSDIPQLPSLKSLLSQYRFTPADISELLEALRQDHKKVLLIDARSENEYSENEIPFAKNFPVLGNTERHNVGLIYKKYSQSAALWLAICYAEPKQEQLRRFLETENASEKEIFVYCWRGGGRSGYLSKMITDLGFNVRVISGGHKAYRRHVSEFFRNEFYSELIELSGMTGSGKTMLLRAMRNKIPVIDLEGSALHYSSLLGRVPYEIENISVIANQAAFENRVFSDISINRRENSITDEVYMIESESKKVGDFIIPDPLFRRMQTAPSIRVVSSLEQRIKRLNRDYFGKELSNTEPMMRIMKLKESFFRQQLSSSTYNELIRFLLNGELDKFTELMLLKYYDVKYKDKGKVSVAEVNADEPEKAVEEITELYYEHKKARSGQTPGN